MLTNEPYCKVLPKKKKKKLFMPFYLTISLKTVTKIACNMSVTGQKGSGYYGRLYKCDSTLRAQAGKGGRS